MRIGYYRDTYVRTDDGWRLKTRAMTFIRRSGDHDHGRPARDRQARSRMTVTTDVPTTAEFRSQLVAWLDENDLTPPPGDHSLDAHHAQHARVLSALYDAGWMRWGWPETAGGLGGPMILRAIVGEEVVGRRLDDPGPYSMLEVLTPTMIDYARPELAAEMVPLLLSGRETWCQGFSEPGSGSDLASLTTRAEQRGDDVGCQRPEGVDQFRAVRAPGACCSPAPETPGTPNHEAITAFFVDMDTPGITVRPLRTMHGVDEFCEVYFDDVAVPADRMLGEPGDGWQLAMDLLPYERSTCFWQRIAYLYSRFDALIDDVKGARPGRGLGDGRGVSGPAHAALPVPGHPAPAGRRSQAGPGHLDRQGAAGRRRTAALRHRTRSAAGRHRTRRHRLAHRVPVFAGGHHLRRHRRSAAQHHRPPPAGPREGVTMDPNGYSESLELLEDGLRKTMLSTSGAELDAALAELGLGRHAVRHVRAGDTAGVPAAG